MDQDEPIGVSPLRHLDATIRSNDAAQRDEIARVFDVPPWFIGGRPRPRFAKLRWALRRVWPL